MISTLPLNALRSFEATARSGSFTRAAEELHVTQSAISHQIRTLEDWIGQSLFERQGNAVKLTATGASLAASLTSTFNELEASCRRARKAAHLNTLTIAVIPSVAACWLIPRLSDFRSKFPLINTRIIYALHGHAIDFSDVDIAITWSWEKPSAKNAVFKKLLRGDSAPVCSAAFLELQGELKTAEQMIAAGLLHDTHRRGWADWIERASRKKLQFDEGPIYEDFNLLRAATLAGQGIALCPLSIIEDDLKSNRLIALSSITVNEDSAYYVVEPADQQKNERWEIKCFRNWLFEGGNASLLSNQL